MLKPLLVDLMDLIHSSNHLLQGQAPTRLFSHMKCHPLDVTRVRRGTRMIKIEFSSKLNEAITVYKMTEGALSGMNNNPLKPVLEGPELDLLQRHMSCCSCGSVVGSAASLQQRELARRGHTLPLWWGWLCPRSPRDKTRAVTLTPF